jgi:hypothetical protein
MFRRRQVIQNELVARRMRRFFKAIKRQHWSDPETVAKTYGQHLWDKATKSLVDEKILSRSRFYIGLSTGNSSKDFERITKRTALISDTLLLSHDWTEWYHELGVQRIKPTHRTLESYFARSLTNPTIIKIEVDDPGYNWTEMYGMHCPSLGELGRWILDVEPLLKAGLVWYLPSYSLATFNTVDGVRQQSYNQLEQVKAIDYLIRDGRAVDASGAEPIKSQLVRPVLRVELPFIEGVSLRTLSEITIEEFASYSAFRDFLRQSLLDIDESQNSVQSERELVKLGLQIKDQIRSVRSEMEQVRRKRAVAVSGAVIGSVGAILVAVYGPALAAAVAAIGASGGVWGVIHATAENSTRVLRENEWYYVWVLAKKSNTHII